MSLSSWSANGAPPSVVFFSNSRYSSRCQPVKAGSSTPAKSSTRESTLPSISSTRPAIGSMRSHGMRDGANASCAAFRLPARTASVNTLTTPTSSSIWATAYPLYSAAAFSSSGLGAAAADVDVSAELEALLSSVLPESLLEHPARTKAAAATDTGQARCSFIEPPRSRRVNITTFCLATRVGTPKY